MADQLLLQGAEEVMRKLRQLSPQLQKKGLRAAARKSMNLVRDAARAKARQFDDPASRESIAKNIVTQESARRSKAVGGVVMRVGVLGGARQYATTRANVRSGKAGKRYKTGGSKGNPGGDTWYWRFLEFGRGPVSLKQRTRGSKRTLANVAKGQFFGKSVGPARAKPFMRPAFSENVDAVTEKMTSELAAEIEKLARTL